ncbi:hypothetical protein WJX72_002290 [[Myrmecia] bisecta]|uniref:Fungal lipase-type domain-containing protein n=1 Tax=[Myrmecia] bisecta TaxID=41462 RepID=A0AAW1Q5P2_9CHLO
MLSYVDQFSAGFQRQVYKAAAGGVEAVASALFSIAEEFPPCVVQLQQVQCSLPDTVHRYALATDGRTLFVAFQGSKELRDVATNINILQDAMWQGEAAAGPADWQGVAPLGVAAVHRGFLARAKTLPVHAIYLHAVARSQDVVFCGHSLGGAVAAICTLRLLRLTGGQARVRCISFGAPAIGNAALARAVAAVGWQTNFASYVLPEDLVPRLLTVWTHSSGITLPPPSTSLPAPARRPRRACQSAVSGFLLPKLRKLPAYQHFGFQHYLGSPGGKRTALGMTDPFALHRMNAYRARARQLIPTSDMLALAPTARVTNRVTDSLAPTMTLVCPSRVSLPS